MNPESSPLKPEVKYVSLFIVVTMLYIAFVYETWTNAFELFQLVPSYLLTGVSVGLFFSILGFRKPYLTTFCISALAPFCSALIYTGVLFISPAHAGGGISLTPSRSEIVIFIIFFIVISVIFGLIAVFGCFLGKKFQSFVRPLASRITSTGDLENVDIQAVKIGAAATIAASFVTGFISISVALMGK